MSVFTRKILKKLKGGLVELSPKEPPRGRVLLSYTTLPFISPRSIDGHTNRWECRRMAEIFVEAGYAVDIVDFDNASFLPKKPYQFCIDVHDKLERFSPFLGKNCVKIFHATTSHWLFNNTAEYERLLDLQRRRGVSLVPQRTLPSSQNLERADRITLLGNGVTEKTYAYAKKQILCLPISTTHLYPSPQDKDFAQAKKGFIWIGGTGMVHKGLDLVLEAFMTLPELHLTIFGKADVDFAQAYKKELSETSNIHFESYIDLGGTAFRKALDRSVGLIFPSCSEGSSGGVVTAMHAGLIPIVSKQSGVDVGEAGVILPDCEIDTIRQEIKKLSAASHELLKIRAISTWNNARNEHTREVFSTAYEAFVRDLLSTYV